MKATLGYGASTCSYADWLHADLIVLFGSNVANNQPVTTKYLHHAKENGAQIAVVNPYREPGLERYWVPSIAASALFGTALADHWFDVHTGGDLRVSDRRAARADRDAAASTRRSSRERTTGFERRARRRAGDRLGRASSAKAARRASDMRRVRAAADRRPERRVRLVDGADAARARRRDDQGAVNVGLARGLPGRPNRGLVPIRGHSGVQGGAEVGCVPSVDAATRGALGDVWGFPVADGAGLDGRRDGRARGAPATSICSGSSAATFSRRCPTQTRSRARARSGRGCASTRTSCCRRRCSSRATATCCCCRPRRATSRRAAAPRRRPSGGSSSRRRFPGRRIGSARPEWWVFRRGDGARVSRSRRLRFGSTTPRRSAHEIARAVPLYAGIETLAAKGDQVQWGGRTLYADGRFATPDGKAHFAVGADRPRRASRGARARSSSRRAAASSSTRWCSATSIR